jgi:hypothetical protein
MRWLPDLAVLFAVTASVAPAQPGTDFSGRWTLASPLTAMPGVATALVVRQSVRNTNLRGEPVQPFFAEISVEHEAEGRTIVETHQIGVIGGSMGGTTADPAGAPRRRQHHAVRWDGPALVFETGTSTGYVPASGEWTERREAWSLDPEGRLHITITTRGSAEASRTVSLIYRRR